MKCPRDETTLQMAEREGIEIDYCPQCRGVWLDGRELDSIIDRAMARSEGQRPQPREREREHSDQRRYEPDHDRYRRQDEWHKGRKHKDRLGFLGDLLGGD
jgi:Zn-finger nucleic acid-binding protein